MDLGQGWITNAQFTCPAQRLQVSGRARALVPRASYPQVSTAR